jgi:hypothetical protein
MAEVLGIAFAAAAIMLVVGALLGRVQAYGRCLVADPRRDLRLRAAFDEGNEGRPPAARDVT